MSTQNSRQTGEDAASAAGKTLADPKAPERDKEAAASALSQAPAKDDDKK